MTGRRVTTLDRHGKFLLASLRGDLTWVTHLGMSGRLSVASPGSPEPRHTNVIVRIRGGSEVRMIDPRTFGFMAVFTPGELEVSSLGALGPDALDDLPEAAVMTERLSHRSVAIKAVLLDQGFVAGIGNIYADEILFRARVAPNRPAGSLTLGEVEALRDSVVPVLAEGVRHGGTSLDDLAYLLPDDRAGAYLGRLAVYGRTGEACRVCGGAIERAVIRQRSTHWCPSCQR